MTEFTIASFNVKNLIEAEHEYYRFEKYTEEEHAWKQDWLADQVVNLGADIIGFQEIFSEKSLRDMLAEADAQGETLNQDVIPDRSNATAKRQSFANLPIAATATRPLLLRRT